MQFRIVILIVNLRTSQPANVITCHQSTGSRQNFFDQTWNFVPTNQEIDMANQQDQAPGINLEEQRIQRDIELQQSQALYFSDDGPPIPTVKGLDPSGKLLIVFSTPIEIWENYAELKDREVAFRET